MLLTCDRRSFATAGYRDSDDLLDDASCDCRLNCDYNITQCFGTDARAMTAISATLRIEQDLPAV
jgi:hypothetical protein